MSNFKASMIAIKLLLFLITFFFQELNSQPNEELEIDRVWSELVLSVKKGDFSKYKTYLYMFVKLCNAIYVYEYVFVFT